MYRFNLILFLLLTAFACTKVEEAPVQIESDRVDVNLNGLNDCFTEANFFAWSTYEILIEVGNMESVLIEEVLVKIEDGDPISFTDFNIVDNQIQILLCYGFGELDQIRNHVTVSGTNKAGEKIGNGTIEFLIDRPQGAH